ncbi:MAG: KDGP aldolase [Bacilli bacterium]
MFKKHQVIFNVLAKDVENGKELFALGGDRVLVGLMVKNFPTEEAAIALANEFKAANVPLSIGLGAADPKMWRKVADVTSVVLPNHINQIFPAAGYTLGRITSLPGSENVIVNAVIEPSGTPGKVYISTGPASQNYKELVSCEMAATMLAEIGVHSVKFYPIEGTKKLEEVAAMVRAAADAGLEIFEPTGGIGLENVHEIVQVCLENGAKCVVPHLYTSLIDKQTGKTRPELVQELLNMKW